LLLRRPIFENDHQNLSLQYKLKMRSLSTVWNENERFWLLFMKVLVFMPKTGSLQTGTELFCIRTHKFGDRGNATDMHADNAPETSYRNFFQVR
jgi:hypothetical protein